MTTIDQPSPPVTQESPPRLLRLRLILIFVLPLLVAVAVVSWILNGSIVNRWLAVFTGLDDLSGSWYGFWSGFGSDLGELALIGAVGTATYQLVKKYNCHEPGCWRVGTHPAAGGEFLLCYRHHPDFQGRKPSHEMIERLHAQHLEHQAAMHARLDAIHNQPPHHGGDATADQAADHHPVG
jgi:hypothetical protein